MDIKKWVPWNWFKKEEEDVGKTVPIQREGSAGKGYDLSHPLQQFHQEVDRIFDHAVRGFGFGRPVFPQMIGSVLKPILDLGATEKEYTITVEIPGVDENEVKLEIVNDTLTIRGEKRQEKEEKEKNYYRVERSYGSFQRVLSLPDDADQEKVKASFKKGVLTITMPRKAMPRENVRKIEISTN